MHFQQFPTALHRCENMGLHLSARDGVAPPSDAARAAVFFAGYWSRHLVAGYIARPLLMEMAEAAGVNTDDPAAVTRYACEQGIGDDRIVVVRGSYTWVTCSL